MKEGWRGESNRNLQTRCFAKFRVIEISVYFDIVKVYDSHYPRFLNMFYEDTLACTT